MSLRLIEIIIPTHLEIAEDNLPHASSLLGRWDIELANKQLLVRMLVDSSLTEGVLDDLQTLLAHQEDYRVMLFSVEATLPRIDESKSDDELKPKSLERISREELYEDVVSGAIITRVFVAQVILATLVAAVGLIRNDTAVIIGAMVIAPLLGPNMSLCLATALGDLGLIKKSLKANAAGLAVALMASMTIGVLFRVDPTLDAIQSRTHVLPSDIILALASGCAGVLAFTSGAPSALIGVMVAVALLPPFAVFGLLLAAGEYRSAGGALMLVATNVICVNLAGVLTFVAQGLRPQSWWDTDRARKATRIAVAIWLLLLSILSVLIFLQLGN